jgi:hypothetical protein
MLAKKASETSAAGHLTSPPRFNAENRKVSDDEAGMLDRWFKTHFPALPFGHLQQLLRTGQVRVDGGRVKTDARLAGPEGEGAAFGAEEI